MERSPGTGRGEPGWRSSGQRKRKEGPRKVEGGPDHAGPGEAIRRTWAFALEWLRSPWVVLSREGVRFDFLVNTRAVMEPAEGGRLSQVKSAYAPHPAPQQTFPVAQELL